MVSSEPQRRFVLLVVTLFVLGVALGATGMYIWDGKHAYATASGPHGRRTREQVESQMNNFLDLNSQQKTQLDGILDASHVRFHALDVQVEPQYDALRQETRNRIRAMLTPDQQAKFEKLTQQWDEDRKKRLAQ